MLWKEGLSGADYLISAFGAAIEIFGKYRRVLDNEGNEVPISALLDYVRQVVTDHAVRQILHNGLAGELSPLTKFYLLWRWAYKERALQFDDARKLAQTAGVDLEREWNRGFIQKDKNLIRLLGPQERKHDDLEDAKELIDVLHKVVKLWSDGRRHLIPQTLYQTGYHTNDAFFRVAQAIAETLPMESKERKLLEGFLGSRASFYFDKTHGMQREMDFDGSEE